MTLREKANWGLWLIFALFVAVAGVGWWGNQQQGQVLTRTVQQAWPAMEQSGNAVTLVDEQLFAMEQMLQGLPIDHAAVGQREKDLSGVIDQLAANPLPDPERLKTLQTTLAQFIAAQQQLSQRFASYLQQSNGLDKTVAQIV
jgi:hypothetical protein